MTTTADTPPPQTALPTPQTALPPLGDAERRPSPTDLWVGAAMLGLGVLGLFLAHDLGDPEDLGLLPPWANYVAFVLLVAPVPFRRMAPAAICAAVGVGFAVFRMVGVPEGPVSSVALFIVIHAAGAHVADPRRRAWSRGVTLATGLIALAIGIASDLDVVGFEAVVATTLSLGINAAFYGAAYVLGDRDRDQRIAQAELASRAQELAREREQRARQAVTAERVRIARELHDVVAHHVSVMGVQAAGARRVLDRDPARAAEALEHVEASGRQAVEELQRLVGVLREGAGDDGNAPQPTLDDVPRLIESMTNAGLSVDLRTIGRPRQIPSSVSLSAYRIVQEALTNVMRHAPGAPTTVVVSHLAGNVQVEVVNGPSTNGAAAAGPGGGRGLVGMRERAAMLGGSIQHGAVPRGGYRVAASLPIGPLPVEALPVEARP